MKTHIKDLQTKGFFVMPYPEQVRAAVEDVVTHWKKFCSLEPEIKRGLPYSNTAAGVGYELKEGVGNKADKKENFDIALSGEAWLTKNSEQIADSSARDFIEKATSLVSLIKPVIFEFARAAEQEFKLKDFLTEVEASEPEFFVRFIHYFGDRTAGEETATAHVDQSGFTLHLFESDPGLQCLTFDGAWIDMPVNAGSTVIIPAMQLQLRSEGRLKALCHRVVADEHTAQEGRYSAVCFILLNNTPKRDKEKTGRLQEKAPGFNYTLPLEEFRLLFK